MSAELEGSLKVQPPGSQQSGALTAAGCPTLPHRLIKETRIQRALLGGSEGDAEPDGTSQRIPKKRYHSLSSVICRGSPCNVELLSA